MARKSGAESQSAHGFNDIIGIILVGFAVLLLVALLSYHPRDVSANGVPVNDPLRNWIGPIGAWMAYGFLRWVGFAVYLVPPLLLLVGLGCFFESFQYLRRRWLWTLVLFGCCVGLLDLYRDYLGGAEKSLFTTAGGILGLNLNQRIFVYFGTVGATLMFLMLYFISLLYLTNFKLGEWLRRLWSGMVRIKTGVPPQEQELEKRSKELQKQAKKLEQDVERSGLGADLQPVPEPTVRDLSVPQARPGGAKGKKPVEPAPVTGEEGEVITAQELQAVSTTDVTGGKSEPKKADSKPATDAEEKSEDQSASAPEPAPHPPARPKYAPKKPKPIMVAATPMIGNYQLPTHEFLQHPDTSIKPTESKEELMANARLMQQTLAQFYIDVSLGDITKGPTITRYELHPAPGVKMEKITGLSNNIAAALKAERIHILAPVPGKSSVGVEVPNAIKTKVIMRDILESDEWRNTKAKIPLALGKDVLRQPNRCGSRRNAPSLDCRQHWVGKVRLH